MRIEKIRGQLSQSGFLRAHTGRYGLVFKILTLTMINLNYNSRPAPIYVLANDLQLFDRVFEPPHNIGEHLYDFIVP